MAQTGVVYAAVAAAAISAGALGFAVIWSYEPAEPPGSVDPITPPRIVAPAGKEPVPPVVSPAPVADARPETTRSAAPPIVTTATPGADARRSEAATARQPAKSSDPSPARSGAAAHARTAMLEPPPTPGIDAKVTSSAEPTRKLT